MNRKHNVVEFDGIKATRKSLKIFVLNVGNPIKRRVEERVKRVAQQVKRQEVEVQSDYRLPLEIYPDLRIKGDRPGHEVNPSDDHRDENDGR